MKIVKEKYFIFFILVHCLLLHTQQLAKHRSKFVVVIASYNNKDWYKRNLDSVFSQDYPYYKVIYADDCSSDGTADLVEQYLKNHPLQDRVKLVRNKKRLYHLGNRYWTNQLVPDDRIIVELDGDDWFSDSTVLSYLNKVYSDENIWLTYGQYIYYPEDTIGRCKPYPKHVLKERTFRQYSWRASHLRSYYAWLFKQIKLECFLFDGLFYQVGADLAYMFPMLEMAGGKHLKAIKRVLYMRNRANDINTEKVWSREYINTVHKHIREKKGYSKVKNPVYLPQQCKADMIVLSKGNNTLRSFIIAAKHYLTGLRKIHVLTNNPQKIIYFCENISGTLLMDCPKTNFKNYIIDYVDNLQSDNIILSNENIVVSDYFDLCICSRELNKTFAHGFYLHLSGDDIDGLPYVYVTDDICAWQFAYSPEMNFANLGMVMYDKDYIIKQLNNINFDTMDELIEGLNNLSTEKHKIGLFFAKSKIVKQDL